MHVKEKKTQCHGPWESCQESSMDLFSTFSEFWNAFGIRSIKGLSLSGVGRHVMLSARILVSAPLSHYHNAWRKIWHQGHHNSSRVIQTWLNWEIRFLTCARKFSHLCPVKAVNLRVGALSLQDLEPVLCLTGPNLNHTAVLEEGWEKQAKAPFLSDPVCFPELNFLQYTLCANPQPGMADLSLVNRQFRFVAVRQCAKRPLCVNYELL